QMADRVTVLRDGESVGTRKVVEPLPRSIFKTAGAAQTAGIPPTPSSQLTQSELIRLMVGREVATIFPPAECAPCEPLLSVKGVGCRASGICDVNLELRSGEILGLAGLVGAGRTELARILFGLTPADSGSITLAGKPLDIQSPRAAVEAGIAYVPEDRR